MFHLRRRQTHLDKYGRGNLDPTSGLYDYYELPGRMLADLRRKPAASTPSLDEQLATINSNILALIAAVSRQTRRPVTVTLNGHTLATAVIRDKAFDGVINEITKNLVYR